MGERKNPKFEAIGKETVVDQAIRAITDAIIRGEFQAGMKLPNEYELITELQISRNSLREAMKILSAMGIVEIRRGDGTYVCSQMNPSLFDHVVYSMIYDLGTSEELLELRQIIDEAIMRLAAEKITQQELQGLYENIQEMEQAIRDGNLEKSHELDMEFHGKMIDSCKNVFFVRIMRGIYAIFEKSISASLQKDREDSLAPYYHRNMLHCIEQKDYVNVGRVVSDSLRTWVKGSKMR